jgi:hypothetical protein
MSYCIYVQELRVENIVSRWNISITLQTKLKQVLHTYSTGNRSLFSQMEYRLELDACIRCCNLLLEHSDMKVNRKRKENNFVFRFLDVEIYKQHSRFPSFVFFRKITMKFLVLSIE